MRDGPNHNDDWVTDLDNPVEENISVVFIAMLSAVLFPICWIIRHMTTRRLWGR